MTPDLQPLLLLLLVTFTGGFTTQLARQFMRETPPPARRLLATAMAAGIASVATSALLVEWFDVSHITLIAVSCVVGWTGAGVLTTLGTALETRLGLRLQNLEEAKQPEKP